MASSISLPRLSVTHPIRVARPAVNKTEAVAIRLALMNRLRIAFSLVLLLSMSVPFHSAAIADMALSASSPVSAEPWPPGPRDRGVQ